MIPHSQGAEGEYGRPYHINAAELIQAHLRWRAGIDADSRYIRFLKEPFRPVSGIDQKRKTNRIRSFPYLQHMNRRFALEQRKIREEVC